jgi:hypothetical protein
LPVAGKYSLFERVALFQSLVQVKVGKDYRLCRANRRAPSTAGAFLIFYMDFPAAVYLTEGNCVRLTTVYTKRAVKTA